MRNIKFLKEPGYIYDLFFLFTLYFNKEFCLTKFINYNKSSEDTECYNRMLDEYLPISDELVVFFLMPDNNRNFMSTFYHEPYITDSVLGKYNLAKVQTLLSDYDQVVENLMKFYFKEIDEKTLNEGKKSLSVINELIKNSKYNSVVKSALYSFFIEPEMAIEKLSHELMEKEYVLSQQYENDIELVTNLIHHFDYELVIDKMKQDKQQAIDIGEFSNVFISFCLKNKNCIRIHFFDEGVLLFLGSDYVEVLDYLNKQACLPELEVFGHAVSERNRIDILNLIKQRKEVTIKDIEQEFGFSGTNAYYHLSLMIKAGMLKTRNRGRIVLYSINQQYFSVLCEMLSNYYKD